MCVFISFFMCTIFLTHGIWYCLDMKANLCSMLQNDEMSIAAVAENVGFSSSSYFISVFKKRMGCTPSEFRKQEKSTELSQRDLQ